MRRSDGITRRDPLLHEDVVVPPGDAVRYERGFRQFPGNPVGPATVVLALAPRIRG